MKTASIQHALTLAKAGRGPFAKIAADSIEVGVVVPSILGQKLTDAGYVVTYHDGPLGGEGTAKNGAWVIVRKDNEVVARAYSHDEPDALLQAIYAAMREEEARAVVAEELAKRNLKVDDLLRQTLESRYITQGGLAKLQEDLDAFPGQVSDTRSALKRGDVDPEYHPQ